MVMVCKWELVAYANGVQMGTGGTRTVLSLATFCQMQGILK